MKRFLIIGAMLVMVAASLFQPAQAGMKDISTDKFSKGTVENLINVTSSEVIIGDELFNDDTQLLIHNNATYSYVSMDLMGGPDADGNYSEDVTVDLGSNQRTDYRFTGPGIGAWGNQSYGFDMNMNPSKTPALYPSPEGHTALVKLPSKAKVSSVDFNINHPAESVVMERLFRANNLDHFGYSLLYYYMDEEPDWDYYYYQFQHEYYPMKYVSHSSSGIRDQPWTWDNYGPIFINDYTSWWGYRYGYGYTDTRYYMQWDLDHPDFMVPDGATIVSYSLNYPVKQTYGSAWNGYDWTSNTEYYYSGEKDYGVFALTDAPLSTFNYNDKTLGEYRNAYNYYYSNSYSKSGLDGIYESVFEDAMPTNRTDPIDSYTMQESFSDSSQVTDYNVMFDLSPVVEEWRDGSLDNNGIFLTMHKTPYSTAPHLRNEGTDYYVTYNSDYDSGSAFSKNHCDFYRFGVFTSPFTTSGSWTSLRPKLLIEYTVDSENPWVDVADDGVIDFSYIGKYEGITPLSGYQSTFNNYLSTHLPDEVDEYGNEWTYVPIKIGADAAGRIFIQNISIKYDYTAKVFYNPTSTNLLNELNTIVPMREDGLTMVPINISASSKGKLTLSNLQLTGTKPNYRPKVALIEDIDVDEGIDNQMFLALSDLFYDEDQPAETLIYKVQKNDKPNNVDIKIHRSEARDGKVYLWIDTSKDPNWHGTVHTQISATDMYGKDTWTNVFGINILPVNDPPLQSQELPPITAEEGLDTLLIEYTAPTGRDIAQGKRSFYFRSDGKPYFSDIEGQKIYLDFELLGADMEPQYLERTTEDGFRIYRGNNNEVSLFVLPPEYTEDPDNFVLVIGSSPDYSSEDGAYYLKVYTSDDKDNRRSQSNYTMPIMIGSVNDPPTFSAIPDINLDEDTVYTGSIKFIETYVHDVDNTTEDLVIELVSTNPSVKIGLTDAGYLHVEPEMDFSGVSQVIVKASDGISMVSTSFNVRVRSINDIPVVIASNIYNGKTIDGMYYLRGTGNDKEKTLRWIEVAIIKEGDILYEDEWMEAEGAYVWQFLLDIREYSDGDHYIMIRAYDGRDYSDVLSFSVMMDSPETKQLSPPPTVTITTQVSGKQSEKLTMEGTATDDSNYVEYAEYRVDGGTWKKAALAGTGWTAMIDTRTLTNEIHNFTVRAFDGKSYSKEAFVRFEVFNEDSDLDGIPNSVEKLYGMDPFNKLDGRMDYDLDGFLNVDEINQGYDPFDGKSHPKIDSDDPILEIWAIIFIAVAVIMTILIIGLFLLNIQMEKNIHAWREDAHSKRALKRPKTLLQKIVELAPTYIHAAPTGPALPTGQAVEQRESLPPAPEGKNN